MPEYTPLAKEITAMRKRGDIEGAITCFKAAPEQQRKLPAAWAAMGWVFYDRDIKPIAPAAQKADPTLRLTDKMVSDALESTGKIKVWCKHDLYSKFSAYPTAYLAVAKILRDREMYSELKAFLEEEDPTQFQSIAEGDFKSHQYQWVGLALDVVKHIFNHADVTRQRVESASTLLLSLTKIEAREGLSRECPEFMQGEKKRTLPSHKQRYYMQFTRFLQDTEQNDKLITACRRAISDKTFERSPNLKWILYRYARALKETSPAEALKVCDDFIALEYRTYSVLLKAEILLACGNREAALREVAHSLQIINERDLPYITKNLSLLASLTDDIEVKKMHIQMVRSIRLEKGRRPNAELEAMAADLNLPGADQAPSAEEMHAIWDRLNPVQLRPRGVGRAADPSRKTGKPVGKSRERFKRDQSRFGEVIVAKIPTKDGEEKFRPVVIVGQDAGELLVAPLQSNTTHARKVNIEQWQAAGLQRASFFVPFFHIVKNDKQKTLGHLTATDAQNARAAC